MNKKQLRIFKFLIILLEIILAIIMIDLVVDIITCSNDHTFTLLALMIIDGFFSILLFILTLKGELK